MKSDDELESIVQRAFLDAFPNLTRLGCPGKVSLQAMLSGHQQSGPDIWQHVSHCSPCAQEILEIRDARRRRRRVWLGLGIAASLLIALSTLFFRATRPGSPSQPVRNNDEESVAALDFRKTTVLRGVSSPRVHVTKVRRETQNLIILLPTFSDIGSYEFDLRAAANVDRPVLGPILCEARAAPDGATKLVVRVDLKALPVGPYMAAWRRSSNTLTSFGPVDLVP